MRIKTEHIIIRDFERKDAENFNQIVREKNIRRMGTQKKLNID